jgi:hypothetical protein
VSFEPYMWATFCDDIRQEAGNKFSYMGVYGPTLIVPSFPTTLMKLCCIFSLRLPAKSPPKHVVFKLLRDEEVIFEADLAVADFNNPSANAPDLGIENLAITVSSVAQLLNFSITQRSILKTRAVVDGKELRGGGMELLASDIGR